MEEQQQNKLLHWYNQPPIIQVVVEELRALYAKERAAVASTKAAMNYSDGRFVVPICSACHIPMVTSHHASKCYDCSVVIQCNRDFCTSYIRKEDVTYCVHGSLCEKCTLWCESCGVICCKYCMNDKDVHCFGCRTNKKKRSRVDDDDEEEGSL